jgi:septal ring factor EnvC (AmiA/AmiB activator)
MNPATKIIASAVGASLALGLAVPASAAAWNAPARLQQQIAQLDSKIERAEARRIISHREARQLDRQVHNLRATFNDFARGGFTRYELQRIDSHISQVNRQLATQKFDGNNRADAGRYDRYDGPRGNYDRYDGPRGNYDRYDGPRRR